MLRLDIYSFPTLNVKLCNSAAPLRLIFPSHHDGTSLLSTSQSCSLHSSAPHTVRSDTQKYFSLQACKLTHGTVTIGSETPPMPGFGSFMFGFGENSEGFLEELFCHLCYGGSGKCHLNLHLPDSWNSASYLRTSIFKCLLLDCFNNLDKLEKPIKGTHTFLVMNLFQATWWNMESSS